MKIPLGATHRGGASRGFYRLIDGKAYRYNTRLSVWEDAPLSFRLLNGKGVHTNPDRHVGYYKIPLEAIMDSFIGGVK